MIDDILLFIRVVEAGSILAVERKFAVPRSTISRRIANFEKEIGSLLLVRKHDGVSLTKEGRDFYERFKDHEKRLANILKSNDEKIGLSGRLNVLLPLSIVSEILIPNYSKFLQQHPKVELNIVQEIRYFNMKKTFYDVALIDYNPLQQAQKMRRAFIAEKVFVCTPQYAAINGLCNSLKEIREHFIVRKSDPDGVVHRYLKFTACQTGRVENIKIEHNIAFSTFHEVKQFVLNDFGIADIPLYIVKREIELGQLIILFPDYKIDGVAYSFLRNIDDKNACYIAFMNFLNAILAESMINTDYTSRHGS
ncbi:MAG TPA: LysR family transcriptional regulator [Burkholderiales bacterium]|jgi:LysR family transcriptional regulator AphB|nr:LysR family transcriptional regulator [Burkholderiales bacterium]